MRHGGDLTEARARYGDDHPWLDLSTGINPQPWPIPPHLRAGDWTRLPSHSDFDRLIEAARAAYAVPPDLALVAAPGTQALIQWLPRLAPPGAVAIVSPTYSEHAASWRAAGRPVTTIADLARLPADTVHLVVVSPNNPDGRLAPLRDLAAAAEACAARGGWLVLDESFADVDPGASAIGRTGHLPVIALRSFGKFYGLAGLRLGFAVGPRELVGLIGGALGPWAVSMPALQIGAAALGDDGWATETRERLVQDAEALDAILIGAGLQVVGGTRLYRLARCPDTAALHDRLARAGIWVRRFDWSAEFLRFGLPPEAAGLERLAAALR